VFTDLLLEALPDHPDGASGAGDVPAVPAQGAEQISTFEGGHHAALRVAEGDLLGIEARQHGTAVVGPVGIETEVGRRDHGPVGQHRRLLDDVRARVRDVLMQMKYAAELETYMKKVRAESEWCVKEKYKEKLDLPDVQACEELQSM